MTSSVFYLVLTKLSSYTKFLDTFAVSIQINSKKLNPSMTSKDFLRIYETSLISAFLTFIIFVKTLALTTHNVLLLFLWVEVRFLFTGFIYFFNLTNWLNLVKLK